MQRVFGDLDALRYVDGWHDDERRAAFSSHLAEHPEEAERVALWARQNESLQAAFASVLQETVPISLRPGTAIGPSARPLLLTNPVSPSPGAKRAATLHALPSPVGAKSPAHATEGGTPQPKTRTRRGPAFKVPAAVLAPVLAAGLVLMIVNALMPHARSDHAIALATGAAALKARATDAFGTYAVDPSHPVEFTPSQMPAFNRWIQRRLGIAIAPADLQAEGWTLLGARLVPGPQMPAAFYIYEDQAGDRLGLYVTHAVTDATGTTVTLEPDRDAGSVMTWNAGGVTYVIAAGKSLDWLSRHAQGLRQDVERANL